MKAYLCVDPAGRILETGAMDAAVWGITGPQYAHCTRYEISHQLKLLIEGEGHTRFFGSTEDEPGEIVGSDLSGQLQIRRKQVINLQASKTVFRCGEQIEIGHDGAQPVKLWAGHRPIAGPHKGRVHAGGTAKLSADAPGYYEIKVRDPRHWAEPLQIQAMAEDSDG